MSVFIASIVLAAIVIVAAMRIVGATSTADGTSPGVRQDTTGGAVATQGHGKYYEATSRGNVFSAQTAATGVAPGTALGTTGAFTLWNPAGSGKKLSIQKLGMGYISGTLGAGVVHICSSNVGDALPTGTAIVPRPRQVGTAPTPVALPFTTSTITTSAGKQAGILCSLNAMLATTATEPFDCEKDIDGEIVLYPGSGITLHATAAAGTSPLVVFSATWEEVPIPSAS